MIRLQLSVSFSQESSEDEYDEDATTAKKIGMVSDKKPVLDDKKLSVFQVFSPYFCHMGSI